MPENIIDPNNPPKVPYVFREYPRHLHKANGKSLIVNNDEEKAAGLKDGWELAPVIADPEEGIVKDGDDPVAKPARKKKVKDGDE